MNTIMAYCLIHICQPEQKRFQHLPKGSPVALPIQTVALNCLLFENVVFFVCSLATDRLTDRQSDKQTNKEVNSPTRKAAFAIASGGLIISWPWNLRSGSPDVTGNSTFRQKAYGFYLSYIVTVTVSRTVLQITRDIGRQRQFFIPLSIFLHGNLEPLGTFSKICNSSKLLLNNYAEMFNPLGATTSQTTYRRLMP